MKLPRLIGYDITTAILKRLKIITAVSLFYSWLYSYQPELRKVSDKSVR